MFNLSIKRVYQDPSFSFEEGFPTS